MTEHPFDVLERELDVAARRQIARTGHARGRSRRRVVVATLAAVLAISAVALAAGSLLSNGAPVAYRYGAPPSPDSHYGTTVPGSVAMLTDDVPDPGGGLPWGLQTFTTSRGFGCIQIGRVQNGKLGVLALTERGSTKLTGRGVFHQLRPAALVQATRCLPLDGAGHTFIALQTPLSTDAVPPSCPVPGLGSRPCRTDDMRTVDAGLLGPRARSITFRINGRTRTAKTLGEAGGYLIVQRPVAPATRMMKIGGRTVTQPGQTPIALTPATRVIQQVAYRDAPTCAVRPTPSIRGACPDPPGFTLIPQPSAKAVRTTVHAFAAPNRRGIRLRFRALAAVTDGLSAYNVKIWFPPRPCTVRHLHPAERHKLASQTCREGIGMPLDRNVRAGQVIRTTFDVPNISKDHRPALRPGTYHVEVSYRVQPPRPNIIGSLAYPGYKVGDANVVVK